MSNNAVVAYVRNDTVQKRIEELLGNRTPQITTSLITAINSNTNLAKCKPESVLNAALTAASMDLPINPNLGFAYIIPYGTDAQFQIGYKGFIQLAQRSGFYRTINTSDVREGEIKLRDRLTGEIEFEWIEDEAEREKAEIVGYVAFFKLMNGFEKSLYMSVKQMSLHGKKYSKSFAKGYGLWVDEFDTMALKTVIKLLISKYGPMSTQLQEAIEKDQAVINDDGVLDYKDNGVKPTGWIPSANRPISEQQKMFLDNILDSQNVTDRNSWMYDNYGFNYDELNEEQAQAVLDDFRSEYKEGQKILQEEVAEQNKNSKVRMN